jgi:hypothetical protein
MDIEKDEKENSHGRVFQSNGRGVSFFREVVGE